MEKKLLTVTLTMNEKELILQGLGLIKSSCKIIGSTHPNDPLLKRYNISLIEQVVNKFNNS